MAGHFGGPGAARLELFDEPIRALERLVTRSARLPLCATRSARRFLMAIARALTPAFAAIDSVDARATPDDRWHRWGGAHALRPTPVAEVRAFVESSSETAAGPGDTGRRLHQRLRRRDGLVTSRCARARRRSGARRALSSGSRVGMSAWRGARRAARGRPEAESPARAGSLWASARPLPRDIGRARRALAVGETRRSECSSWGSPPSTTSTRRCGCGGCAGDPRAARRFDEAGPRRRGDLRRGVDYLESRRASCPRRLLAPPAVRTHARPVADGARALRAEGRQDPSSSELRSTSRDTRRSELTREAARLFAQKGYHGTSIGDIAEALGVQKGSLYAHIASKEDLLYETMREGAAAFHGALDAIPEDAPAPEKIRLALRGHLRVVAEQLDVATVFVQEWRYLEGARRDEIVAERRRYEERIRDLFREGRELGELRADLDEARRRAAPALGGELGLHLAPARPRHRRARRPLPRAARRRDARLLDARRRSACSARAADA